MSKKKKKLKEQQAANKKQFASDIPQEGKLHPHTWESIWGLVYAGIAIILVLSGFDMAGPVGSFLKNILTKLLGVGYFLGPLILFTLAGVFLTSRKRRFVGITSMGAGLAVFAILGLIDIFAPAKGGLVGLALGALKYPFGNVASAIINFIILCASVLVVFNIPLKLNRKPKDEDIEIPESDPEEEEIEEILEEDDEEGEEEKAEDKNEDVEPKIAEQPKFALFSPKKAKAPQVQLKDYTPPPLSLLQSSTEKPTTGDLRANANIIKRTLESFGIPVEMGEINIGPKVTRYTLKPAEGVKLSRITALGQDMALALAAHPIRIEAPIPGKSLVGIEVPNKTAALVRLGSLMNYDDFQNGAALSFAIGRDVTGEPIFGDIQKMPHLLVAGATGSGKSVVIHSIITSLLYKNGPSALGMILIDPKRVELSAYAGLPHLISPVITENKKAMGVFRWALQEMDRRYELLQKAGNRDIKSYNAGHKEEPLRNIVIVIDEMADLMSTYGREVEGSIVRLAQMARATGIHLILSTQRPSVEVITGLIKANIPSRIALQVASQIDSRTILDTAGAEKLLGGGDLLFMSAELSKPRRIQGAYITEGEINKVADFIRENNSMIVEIPTSDGALPAEGSDPIAQIATSIPQKDIFEAYLEDDSDELYDEAVTVVASAQKASASLLQRRLQVGYSRAARLMDLMEEKGVIGPGNGAKPREVYVEKPAE